MEKKKAIICRSYQKRTAGIFACRLINGSDKRKILLTGGAGDTGNPLSASGGMVVFMFVFQQMIQVIVFFLVGCMIL